MLSDFFIVVMNTLTQSLLSSSFSIFLGFLGAIGLLSIKNSKVKLSLESLCLYSSFLPPIFIILSTLNILSPFPYGLIGIVVIHIVSLVPFSSLIISKILQDKLSSLEKMAYIQGSSLFFFLKKGFFEIKTDILSFFIYLNVIFVSSFSVPLIAGHDFRVIETYIYDLLKVQGLLKEAIYFSIFQIIVLFVFLKKINFKEVNLRNIQISSALYNYKQLLFVIFIPLIFILFGTLRGLSNGVSQFMNLNLMLSDILLKFLESMKLGLSVAFLSCLCLIVISYFYDSKKIKSFFYSLTMPSAVVVGVFFWAFFSRNFLLDFQLSLALVLLNITTLYRLEVHDTLSSISKQVEVAQLMGAERDFIFKKIVLPQVLPSIFFVSGLGGLWAVGDFAITQMILGNDSNLALFISSLMSQYRLDLASLLMLPLFLCGLMVYFVFGVMKYVYR